MSPVRRLRLRSACTALMLCLGGLATEPRHVLGQGYDTWSKVESAEETRTYSQELGAGTFDAAQQGVLERIILPQLEKPANRPTIAQVRQRMREVITRGTTNPKIFDSVNAVTVGFLAKLVEDDSKDVVIRVNALLLIGELVAADRKAWPGSIETLAKAAGDAKLPLAVRIAAMSGLLRQINDGRSGDPAFAKAVAPVVTAIITAPPEGDPRAVAWIVGRCLDMLPAIGGSPEVLEAAASILADEKADLDLRIRAAIALGRFVKPGAAPDLTAAVAQMREIAIMALSKDLDEAESRRFAKQLSGGLDKGSTGTALGMAPPTTHAPMAPEGGGLFGFGGEPTPGADAPIASPVAVDPDAVPALACRRNSWRLVALADALQPEATKGSGIASVLTGDAAAEALQLATVLRDQGLAIDATPDEQSVKTALAALEDLAKPAAPGAPADPAGQQAEPKTTPAPADSPFGGSSPF